MRLLILLALAAVALATCPKRGPFTGSSCEGDGVCQCGTSNDEQDGLCRCLSATITDLADLEQATESNANNRVKRDSRRRRKKYRKRFRKFRRRYGRFHGPGFFVPRHFAPHHFFTPRQHFFHSPSFHPGFGGRHFGRRHHFGFDEAPENNATELKLPAQIAFERNVEQAMDEASPKNEMDGKMMSMSPMVIPASKNFGTVMVCEEVPQMIVVLKKNAKQAMDEVKEPMIVVREAQDDENEKEMIKQVMDEIEKEVKEAETKPDLDEKELPAAPVTANDTEQFEPETENEEPLNKNEKMIVVTASTE